MFGKLLVMKIFHTLVPLTSFVTDSVHKFSGTSEVSKPTPKIFSQKLYIEYTITRSGDSYTISISKEKNIVDITVLPSLVNRNPSDYNHTNNLIGTINAIVNCLKSQQSTILPLIP